MIINNKYKINLNKIINNYNMNKYKLDNNK